MNMTTVPSDKLKAMQELSVSLKTENESLRAQITELKAENSKYTETCERYKELYLQKDAENVELKRQRDEYKADAERYRGKMIANAERSAHYEKQNKVLLSLNQKLFKALDEVDSDWDGEKFHNYEFIPLMKDALQAALDESNGVDVNINWQESAAKALATTKDDSLQALSELSELSEQLGGYEPKGES